MYNIHVIQANYGDCILLEYGTSAASKYALIDGGPKGVWNNHLKGELERLADQGAGLDFIAISHADTDHITGIIDFFSELESLQSSNQPPLLPVDALWYNSFSNTIDTAGANIHSRLSSIISGVASPHMMAHTNTLLASFDMGNQLRIKSQLLGLSVNEGFPDNIVVADTAPIRTFDNLKITIVGPTRDNLTQLRTEWLEWLEENEPALATGDPQTLANADKSAKNLASIMFLVETNGTRSLFTGDGRSDHLLQGLEQANLLDHNGSMHLDVLKVMHHGSDRNVTRTFFKKVTAETYIISANGHPDNPDLSTLIWLVEAAKEFGRNIHIIATNETRATRKLVKEYPPVNYGYTLEVMPHGSHSRVIELAS